MQIIKKKMLETVKPFTRAPISDYVLQVLYKDHPKLEGIFQKNTDATRTSSKILSAVLSDPYYYEVGEVKSRAQTPAQTRDDESEPIPTKVRYFSKSERDECLVYANADGKLVDVNGKLLHLPKPSRGKGYGFVMDTDGAFYVFEHKGGEIHHSSPLSGKSCLAAGVLETNAEGELISITNDTGHFKTNELQFYVACKVLQDKFPKAVNFFTNKTQGNDHTTHIGCFVETDDEMLNDMEEISQKTGRTKFERLIRIELSSAQPLIRSTICSAIEKYSDHPDLIKTVLKEQKLQINTPDVKFNNMTPLELAVQKEDVGVVAMLLLHGADPTQSISDKESILHQVLQEEFKNTEIKNLVSRHVLTTKEITMDPNTIQSRKQPATHKVDSKQLIR